MKQPQYSRYERGLRDIPTDILIKLAKFYKTSTDYILGVTNGAYTAHLYENSLAGTIFLILSILVLIASCVIVILNNSKKKENIKEY